VARPQEGEKVMEWVVSVLGTIDWGWGLWPLTERRKEIPS